MSRPRSLVAHQYTPDTGVSLELPVGFEPTLVVQPIGTFRVDPAADPHETVAARLSLLRETADAVAASGTVQARRLGNRDGAVTEELDLTEPDGTRQWTTLALTAGRLVSIVARLAAERVGEVDWEESVEEMRASVRFVHLDDAGTHDPDAEWSTLTDLDLGISLEAPSGWEAVQHEGLLLRAPEGTEEKILPLLAIAAAAPEGDTWEWFEAFTAQVLHDLTQQGAAELDTQRFALSSHDADVFTVTTRLGEADDPADPPRVQLVGWIWGGPTQLYQVQAHTGPSRAVSDVETFDRMVRSIRLLATP